MTRHRSRCRANYVLVDLSKASDGVALPKDRYCVLSFSLGLRALQLWRFVIGVGTATT